MTPYNTKRAIWMCSLVCIATVCTAQPNRRAFQSGTTDADRALLELENPSLVLMLVQEAYRQNPVSDRVEVRYWESGQDLLSKPARTSVVQVHIYPQARIAREDGTMDTAPALGIELEQTRVQIVDDVCEVVGPHNTTLVYRTRLQGTPSSHALAEAVRPLPLPQLEFAFGHGARLDDLGPGLSGITWTSVLPSDIGGRVRIRGRIRGNEVTVEIDSRTKRLTGASFPVQGDPAMGWIELHVEHRQAPAITSWVRDHTDRTEVRTIAKLAHVPTATLSTQPGPAILSPDSSEPVDDGGL